MKMLILVGKIKGKKSCVRWNTLIFKRILLEEIEQRESTALSLSERKCLDSVTDMVMGAGKEKEHCPIFFFSFSWVA
jgi:hypothetical protein